MSERISYFEGHTTGTGLFKDTRRVDTAFVNSLAKQARRYQHTNNQNTNYDTNAPTCEPELKQFEDYIAAVIASFDMPEPEDGTAGIPFAFTNGMMDITDNDLLPAIKSHVRAGTFT